jgi:hypothetical protein
VVGSHARHLMLLLLIDRMWGRHAAFEFGALRDIAAAAMASIPAGFLL